jgi:hypothetical protein
LDVEFAQQEGDDVVSVRGTVPASYYEFSFLLVSTSLLRLLVSAALLVSASLLVSTALALITVSAPSLTAAASASLLIIVTAG